MKSFMEKTKLTDISKYEAIILEDDETSKQRANKATDEDVIREIEILLGPTKEWSSESEEVQTFRKSMKRYVVTRGTASVVEKHFFL
jgi:hypothetical protein